MFGNATQAQTTLFQINREIAQTRNSIDSVRRANANAVARRLHHNTHYQYICENAAYVDTLERVNARLLDNAIKLIHKSQPGAVVLRTPVIFIQYRRIPGVASIERMYNNNRHIIYEYNRHVTALRPEYQTIKNRCDSAMHAQIDIYQLRLDSLLNRKLELVR